MKAKFTLNRKGFSLFEMLSVIVLLTVFMGMFYQTWMMNYASIEEHNMRADLWLEANQIIEKISLDGRQASTFDIANNKEDENDPTSEENKTVIFKDPDGVPFTTYKMVKNGDVFVRNLGEQEFRKIAGFVNFENSSFDWEGDSLMIKLAMSDEFLGRPINILATTEVLPRNK